MSHPLIEVKNVSKRYADHQALSDVSLTIRRGSTFGLLGPNGAGKTSLLRILTQITAPDQGEVLLEGKPLRRQDIARIGYLPEERGLYPKMKVGEQILYLASLKGVDKAMLKTRLDEWSERLGFADWMDKRVNELSKGMQQKIQFACSVLHEPELLILDEPFSGFDPVNADLLKREVLRLRDGGTTIILSTHNMHSVEELCQDIALVNQSRIILSGEVGAIRQSFSKPRYQLELSAPLGDSALEVLSPSEYEPLPLSGGARLVVELPEGRRIRDFIHSLPQGVDVRSLRQDVPSMHEIFVTLVSSRHHE